MPSTKLLSNTETPFQKVHQTLWTHHPTMPITTRHILAITNIPTRTNGKLLTTHKPTNNTKVAQLKLWSITKPTRIPPPIPTRPQNQPLSSLLLVFSETQAAIWVLQLKRS